MKHGKKVKKWPPVKNPLRKNIAVKKGVSPDFAVLSDLASQKPKILPRRGKKHSGQEGGS